MLIKNNALSMNVIGVSIDVDKSSDMKQWLAGRTEFAVFWKSAGMRAFITSIVDTAFKYPFTSRQVLRYDAIQLTVESPYTQNTVFGIIEGAMGDKADVRVMNRAGRSTVVGGVSTLDQGIIVECPVTMLITALCAREQLLQLKKRGLMSETQKSTLQERIADLDSRIDTMSKDASSIGLMGEQAIAVHEGDIYFHQPVVGNWMTLVDTIDFSLAPQVLQDGITNFRSRAVDVFKGVTGSAGTLDEIEAMLDGMGVGSHMTSTPWLKVRNEKTFRADMTDEMLVFLEDNAQYACGYYLHYLQGAYGSTSMDPKSISGAAYDFGMKLKRLGVQGEFVPQDQDNSVSAVIARAFRDDIEPMAPAERAIVLNMVQTAADLRFQKIGWNMSVPEGATRSDLVVYKRMSSLMSHPRGRWPGEFSDKLTKASDVDGSYLVFTLPSGALVPIRPIVVDVHHFMTPVYAVDTIDGAMHGELVLKCINFLEQLESLCLYLMNPNVELSDIKPPSEPDAIYVGGQYPLLSDALHFAIASPNPVVCLPV